MNLSEKSSDPLVAQNNAKEIGGVVVVSDCYLVVVFCITILFSL